MKKAILILLLAKVSFAACPLSTYPENHKLDQEINNLCDNILNPVMNYATISQGSITSLAVSTMTLVSSATVKNLSATNLTVTNINGSAYQLITSSQASTIATATTTSGSFQAVGGLSLTITPASTSTKFLVIVNGTLSQTANAAYVCFASVRRNGVDLSGNGEATVRVDTSAANVRTGSANMNLVDAPATISAVTYSVVFSADGVNTCAWNRDLLLSTIKAIPIL